MDFDPAISSRALTNERLRIALGWGEYRDLGGALALTSDAPIEDLNRIESFTTDKRRLDGLLDIGFALLRAFDCAPAVCLTPLDRPLSLEAQLERRGLRERQRSVTMVFRGDAAAIPVSGDVAVRRAGPDDAAAFRDVAAGSEKWARRLFLGSTIEGMQHPGNTYYIGSIDGQPAGSMHVLIDHATAGISAVRTLRTHRKRGVCSALLATAIRDAQSAGCDVITLRTASDGDARRLFATAGFVVAHENALWVGG